MKKILISIKPEYVDLILKNIKRFEYRKSIARNNPEEMIIYSTYPEMNVVASAKIKGIIKTTPEKLWALTYEYGGVSKMFFDAYFAGCEKAYAYVLGEVKAFEEPKMLRDFNVHHAPQTFVYIKMRDENYKIM